MVRKCITFSSCRNMIPLRYMRCRDCHRTSSNKWHSASYAKCAECIRPGTRRG